MTTRAPARSAGDGAARGGPGDAGRPAAGLAEAATRDCLPRVDAAHPRRLCVLADGLLHPGPVAGEGRPIRPEGRHEVRRPDPVRFHVEFRVRPDAGGAAG